jgi:glutathione S-transferase
VTIPKRLLKNFPGVDDESAGYVLVQARPPGCVLLREWATAGQMVLETRRALVAAGDERLAELDNLFSRGRLLAGGKLHLPPLIIAHLNPWFHLRGLFIVRYPRRLELWSARYRERRLRDAPEIDFGDDDDL